MFNFSLYCLWRNSWETNPSFLEALVGHQHQAGLGHLLSHTLQQHHQHRMILVFLLILLDQEGPVLLRFPFRQLNLVSVFVSNHVTLAQGHFGVVVCKCRVVAVNLAVQFHHAAQVDLLLQDPQDSHNCLVAQASLPPPADLEGHSCPGCRPYQACHPFLE